MSQKETPEEIGRRLNLPVTGSVPKIPRITEPNPPVAVCGKCGMIWKKISWFHCSHFGCPVQVTPTV